MDQEGYFIEDVGVVWSCEMVYAYNVKNNIFKSVIWKI